MCYLQEIHLKYKNINKFKVKGWKMIYSWPLNDMGLNCKAILIRGFFSINTYYSARLSAVGWIHWWRTADTEEPTVNLHEDFQLHGGLISLTSMLFKDQLYNTSQRKAGKGILKHVYREKVDIIQSIFWGKDFYKG